jgi:hypothetical protein
MTYRLDLMPMGKLTVPGPEVFWMSQFEQKLDLTFWMGVLRNDKHTIVVNTGVPSIEVANKYGIKEIPEGGAAGALAQINVKADEVDYVIATPFQAYAIGNVDHFPNAEICLSRKGWIDFHAPKWRKHPHDKREMCIPPHILKYLVIDAWDRVKLLEDEDTIADDVGVFWTGTHHRSSIAVSVETESGRCVLSDAMFYTENVSQMHPLGINESMEECLEAYSRIQKIADHVVPLYDPRIRTNF